jgi:hypothetical protein
LHRFALVLRSRYMGGTRRRKTDFELTGFAPHAAGEIFERAGHSAWWRVEGGNLATPLLLRLGRSPEDEIVCTGIAMGLDNERPVRVTASAMRVPLQAIVAQLAREMRFDKSTAAVFELGTPEALASIQRLAGTWTDSSPRVPTPRARPGAKGYTDDDLREFAQQWRQALRDNPRAPTKTLAQKRFLTEAAIRYQRRSAERRGYLARSDRHPRSKRKAARDGKTR